MMGRRNKPFPKQVLFLGYIFIRPPTTFGGNTEEQVMTGTTVFNSVAQWVERWTCDQ